MTKKRTLSLPSWKFSTRTLLLGVLAALLAGFAAAVLLLAPESPGRELRMDELDRLTERQRVAVAVFRDEDARIVGRTTDGETFWVAYPASDTATSLLLEELVAAGAEVSVDGQPVRGMVRLVTTGLLPLLILATLLGLMFTGSSGQGGDVRGFGTMARRGRGAAEPPATRFADVAGADDAVAELREVVDYLRDPDRYRRLGATPPKGVLLFGPPGTGKTLIARATAGEAGVSFFSVAGAEFVESLVGVGAARVRDLFEHVRAAAPAILFIDEIDAAGRRRGGEGGGSEEREQTLNQLLVEMDGFSVASGVVVMAATNRPDILDPALLRPGRFDRHVAVEPPDLVGRERILRRHVAGRPLDDTVDLAQLARRTPGFTGADLANVVNEASLLAVRARRDRIGSAELVAAAERVVSGTARAAAATPELAHRLAVHEVGRALVVAATGGEVHRVSLVSRGRSLDVGDGPDAGNPVLTRGQLVTRLVVAQAGRAAERVVLGETSTLGEADLEAATQLAADMVTRYAMADGVGQVRLAGAVRDGHLGGVGELGAVSDATRLQVEATVRTLLDGAFDEAQEWVAARRHVLDRMVRRLVVEESLEGEALAELLDAEAVVAPV